MGEYHCCRACERRPHVLAAVAYRTRVEMAGGHMPVSASVEPSYWADASHVVSVPSGWIKPSPHRALDIAEILGIVEDYRKAAERA